MNVHNELAMGGIRRLATWMALALPLLVPAGVQAQEKRSYAVLSLAADKMTIVIPRGTTGGYTDRNLRNAYPMPDDSMDIAAVQAAEVAIKRVDPTAAVELYATREPKMFAALEEAGDSAADSAPVLLNSLGQVLAQTKATHLLLISKGRTGADFQLKSSTIGVGKISGIGFYVDESVRLVDTNTQERRRGYVAPFAALKVQLIDLKDRKTIKDVSVDASDLYSGSLSAKSAWDTLSPADKTRALQSVIEEATQEGVGRVLAGP